MRRFLRFRVSTLLLAMVTLGVALAWWRDHSELQRELSEQRLLRHVLREAAQRYAAAGYLESPIGQLWSAQRQEIDDKLKPYISTFLSSDAGGAFLRDLDSSSREAQIEVLAVKTDHDDSQLRAFKLRLMFTPLFPRLPPATAVPHFVTALQDPDEAVRWYALWGLEDLEHKAAAAVPALRAVADGRPSPFAVSALAVLLRFDPPAEIVGRLIRVLEDADGPTRLWAVSVLQEVPRSAGAAAVPKLVELLDDPEDDVRRAVLDALACVAVGDDVTRQLLRRYERAESAEELQWLACAIQRIEALAGAPPGVTDAFPDTSRGLNPSRRRALPARPRFSSEAELRAEVDRLRTEIKRLTLRRP